MTKTQVPVLPFPPAMPAESVTALSDEQLKEMLDDVPEDMNEFFFTFGHKYRTESHPQGGHPDGYFTIVAPDAEQARDEMFRVCGPAWSHEYKERPSLDRYPRGELRRITVTPKPTNTESNESKPTN